MSEQAVLDSEKDPQTIPIYKGQDFYIPAFEVKLGDVPLKRSVFRDIIQVSYKDSLTDVDSFELTINNWDAAKKEFKYSDQHIFDPGKKVELWMGYYGKSRLRLMLTGEITSLRPSFPSGGQPTLTVSGLNLLHRLRKKQESFAYNEKTDNQIAQQIAGRLGVKICTQDKGPAETIKHNYLFQDNQYDVVYLLERARRIGYDLFVKEDGSNGQARPSELYFIPSQDVKRISYELKYGISLIDFSPELTTANQVGKVTVRGWDAIKKEPINVTVTRDQLKTKGVGKKGGQAEIEKSFADREEVIVNQPVRTKAEARQLAKETLENIAKEMVKGGGSIVGLPDLRAGVVIYINGLGDRFSGRYFVTGTTHSIGSGGYITRFECRREELGAK